MWLGSDGYPGLMLFKKIFGEQRPRFRISLGLSGMLVSLLLVAAIVGLIPDRNQAIRDGHAQLAEAIAVNSSIFITVSDIRRMEANLQVVVERNEDIQSAAIRRSDGTAMVVIGEHDRLWRLTDMELSSESQVRVPIYEGSNDWGQVELTFEPLLPKEWYGELLHPVFVLLTFISITSFIVFYWYLGKMLKQLDPSQAIPDRVRSALDTMAEGLLVLDAKQNVVMANLAFSTLVDEASDALIGRQISRFPWIQQNDEPLLPENAAWTKTLQDGAVRTADMIRLNVKGGKSKTFMTNCSPILSGSGKPAGVLISFDDVTELEQKELELRVSRDEAEQANRFKSEFLANMSHEIRTPMNAILGFAEVLKRGYNSKSSDSIRYLNTISSSGTHLLNLINDILDLSKVEAGQIDIEKIETPAHQIIHEVVQIMRVKADEKGIYLRYEPDGQLPEYVYTDTGKLRQIITNLVGNAIKFTDGGGVRIVSRLEKNGADNLLAIDVIDTGIGMTEEQAAGVFNPFTQADSSITRRFGGTGLGLTISKSFSEALGGDIVIHSEQGKGSRFTLRVNAGAIADIPLLSVDELLSMSWHEKASEHQHWRFPGSKVLVVDDGAENRELLEVVLSDVGIQVETAENGQVALDYIASQHFDAVLMDVQMPVMDGYAAATIMRKQYPDLPVIAMTADAMKGAEQKCLDAGFSQYMTKPVEIDKMIDCLADLLGGEILTEGEVKANQSDASLGDASSHKTQAGKIYSSLPMSNPKFRSIVEKFIIRLKDQLVVIDSAWQQRNYDELKRLGHWLKGSAGSVGFIQFVEPSKAFEQYAIDRDDANIEAAIAVLHSLAIRLDSGTESDLEKEVGSAKQENKVVKEYDIPPKLRCRLLDTSPRLRPIIDRFVDQLLGWLERIDDALERDDFVELEKFAYWLKATGGSVGFDAFTEPAIDLEKQVKKKQVLMVRHTVSVIKELSGRFDLTEMDRI